MKIPLLLVAALCAAASSLQAAPLPATAQAVKAGIMHCLPTIEKVEAFLAANHDASALAFWNKAAPNANLFSALLALENNTTNSLANLNVMPSSDGQCTVEYTHTGYAPTSCIEHLRSLGNDARFARDLNRNTALIEGKGVQICWPPPGQAVCGSRRSCSHSPAPRPPPEVQPAEVGASHNQQEKGDSNCLECQARRGTAACLETSGQSPTEDTHRLPYSVSQPCNTGSMAHATVRACSEYRHDDPGCPTVSADLGYVGLSCPG